jgi:RNA polymerase sigma-70 factor (ECF subfamily)
MCRVRAGDEAAAAELVRLYEPAIRRAARIRLADSRLRRLFDSLDISQSVFASFFARAARGQYELEEPGQLLRLLVAMSRKKFADHVRRQQAARRDYRRLEGIAPGRPDPRPGPGRQAAARELLHECHGRLSAHERRLADLRASGRSWEQIAASEGASAEALRKQLARGLDRVARELGLDGTGHG